MKLFAIADTHLSFGVEKPMDIFRGWDNYTQRMEKSWQETVSQEDTVVIAGDISWGMTLEECLKDFQFLHRLNGSKIILKGNHDYWFATKQKTERFFEEHGLNSLKILFNNYYPFGEYGICGTRGWINETNQQQQNKIILRECGRLKTSLEACRKDGKIPIAFLHYPPVSMNAICQEMLDVLREYKVSKVYYGHLHGKSHQYAVLGLHNGIDYHLISGDFIQFCPVKVVQINNL